MPCRAPISADAKKCVENASGKGFMQRICHLGRALEPTSGDQQPKSCQLCQSRAKCLSFWQLCSPGRRGGGAKNAAMGARSLYNGPVACQTSTVASAPAESGAFRALHPCDMIVAPVRIAHGGASCIRIVLAHFSPHVLPAGPAEFPSTSGSESFTPASARPSSGRRC